MKLIDLRSDTVTRPTQEMFAAMQTCTTGDDVLGDDPTVMELEALAAQMLGHESAVFVPSGTMGNQIALACHCQRGDAVILDEEAHIFYYEVGAPAIIAQVVLRACPSVNGAMDPADIERRVLKQSLHTPGTTLLCVENTHNRSGGQVIPMDVMREYRALCDRHGMKLHLDGARMFNASTWLGAEPAEIATLFDSVSICLSKGLGSPVGSVLVGGSQFIDSARVWRKRLGGGMRQSGLLAACGLVSLRTHLPKLAEDHRRAGQLAAGLSKIPGLLVETCTNFVMVTVPGDSGPWLTALEERGVLAMPPAPNRIRLVLHSDIHDADIPAAIAAFTEVSEWLNPRSEAASPSPL